MGATQSCIASPLKLDKKQAVSCFPWVSSEAATVVHLSGLMSRTDSRGLKRVEANVG